MVPLVHGFSRKPSSFSLDWYPPDTVFPLESELMLVGRVPLPFIGAGVVSETSEAWLEEMELSSKLSLMVSDRVCRIEPPFTLSLVVARPNWFAGSRLRMSALLEKIVDSSFRNEGISSRTRSLGGWTSGEAVNATG